MGTPNLWLVGQKHRSPDPALAFEVGGRSCGAEPPHRPASPALCGGTPAGAGDARAEGPRSAAEAGGAADAPWLAPLAGFIRDRVWARVWPGSPTGSEQRGSLSGGGRSGRGISGRARSQA